MCRIILNLLQIPDHHQFSLHLNNLGLLCISLVLNVYVDNIFQKTLFLIFKSTCSFTQHFVYSLDVKCCLFLQKKNKETSE